LKRNKPIFTRTQHLEASDGEQFFFQLLIKNIPFRAFSDLLSNVNLSQTFKEECIIKNIWITNDEEWIEKHTKSEKINIYLKDESTKLFIRNNFECKNLNQTYKKAYFDENTSNANSLPYDTIQSNDQKNNHESFNMDKYIKINSNLIDDLNKLDDKLKQLTSDQKNIVEYIEKNIDQQLLIFISGNGGSGKSYLLQIIYEILTLNCLTVRKLATTGNAAKLIEGETVHSFFSINTENKCTLPYKSPKWHAIRSSDVIIIDEISMMSHELLTNINDVLNAIDTHNAVQNEKVKFGSIILVGDLLQLPAVSTIRLPITQLYKSILFKNYFIPFIMEINVRAIDVEFAKFLSKCRVGSLNDEDFQYIKLRVCGIGHARTEECDKIYNSLSLCSLHQKEKKL
jgi:hypothetical protein